MCLHSRGPSTARANYGQYTSFQQATHITLLSFLFSLQSRARCRLLPTLPSPLSRAHATPSGPLPSKVHNVIEISKRLLERTMSPYRLIVILFHASPPLCPINSHTSLLSPPPPSPCPPTAKDCRHLTSLSHARTLQMTATASPLSWTCDYCHIASLLSGRC